MNVLFLGTEQEALERVRLAVHLRWPDATVSTESDPEKGLEIIEREPPDAVILQWDPRERANGERKHLREFIVELRGFSDVALIVLGNHQAVGQLEEVMALEAGADDYVRFTPEAGFLDLIARIVAVMRRVSRTELSAERHAMTSGPLVLNPATYEVFLEGKEMNLTSTEFRLLHLLLKHHGTVVTHRLLEVTLWGDHVDSSALAKKYVQRLRRKLSDDCNGHRWILNVHGVGYRFVGAPEPAFEPAIVA